MLIRLLHGEFRYLPDHDHVTWCAAGTVHDVDEAEFARKIENGTAVPATDDHAVERR
jgi:hypothetical protein